MTVAALTMSFFFGTLALVFATYVGASLLTSLGFYVISGLFMMGFVLALGLIRDYLTASSKAGRMDAKFISEPKLFLAANSEIKRRNSVTRSSDTIDMNILLVDDDDVSLGILSEMLKAIGFSKITSCLSGYEAERAIAKAQTPFDCMFLDIQMPDYDGIQLAGAVRKLAAYKDTPIIMVTAMTDRNHISRAFSAGANDYITKPLAVGDLEARIRAAEAAFCQTSLANKSTSSDPVQLILDQADSDITDTVQVIGGIVTKAAIENYLRQIERGGIFATNFIAVKIRQYEQWSVCSDPAITRTVLAKVSDALLVGLNDRHAFVAYVGDGVFACVVNGQQSIDLKRVKIVVDAKLTQIQGQFSGSSRVELAYSDAKSFVVRNADQSSLLELYTAVEDVKELDEVDTAALSAPGFGNSG